MSVRRMVARVSAAVGLLAAVTALLVVPVAMASAATGTGADGGDPVSSASGTPVPAVLASTGLDLTTPIVVGLTILLLGTALVAWAVLRGSGGSHRGA